MLTPKDLVTDSVSGYKHVHRRGSSQKRALAWYAEINHRPGGRVNERAFRGPSRATPLEAAQDYCDYANAKPLTPDDLRDPSVASGYKYVGSASPGNKRPDGSSYQFWRAKVQVQRERGLPGSRTVWSSKTFYDPRDAAQAYCDYINGQQRPQRPVKLNQPGHAKRDQQMVTDPEVADALGVLRDHRAQKAGRPGFIYCMTEADWASHPITAFAVKVGYSTNPKARVGELQTGNPRELVLLAYRPGTKPDEAALHAKYIKDNMVGEWFKPSIALLAEFDLIKGGSA